MDDEVTRTTSLLSKNGRRAYKLKRLATSGGFEPFISSSSLSPRPGR
jgi:hypothetical protein